MGFSKYKLQCHQGEVSLIGEGIGEKALDSGPKRSLQNLIHLFEEKGNPQEIGNKKSLYVNGLFVPFYIWNGFKGNIILAPRGMASPSALKIKNRKKKWYLNLFKFLGYHQRIVFHVTSKQEELDIRLCFGDAIKTVKIANVPCVNVEEVKKPIHKKKGNIKMITVAQVSPMKNHDVIIKAINLCHSHYEIEWDFVGGPLYPQYFNSVMKQIKQVPSNVKINYLGKMNFTEIQNLWKKYHIQILPSKSENFGHAHFEGLANGLPLITSNFVPWKKLKEKNAGINSNLSPEELASAIGHFCQMDLTEFGKWRSGALIYARSKVDLDGLFYEYQKLFFG